MAKTWTRDEIDEMLRSSDTAVERAMITLFKNKLFWDADVETGTHFAQWLLGMNGRNKTVYPAKSLSHQRAVRRFRKFCLRGESPIDQARRIALIHSARIVQIANGQSDDDKIESEIDDIVAIWTGADMEINTDVADEDTDDVDDIEITDPPLGTWSWADTARLMAQGDDSGFDWDSWKDEMKERDCE